MAPKRNSATMKGGIKPDYGSVLENGNNNNEEGKYQSFSDNSNDDGNANTHYDMEQMRLIVSSFRQHQQQGDKPTTVPPFTPDAYYYHESRQRWRRMILGILAGVLAGWLLTKGWNSGTTTPSLKAHLALEGEYDYIVVGGGPSGILAATRLAQKLPSAQVVLVESGTASQSTVLRTLKDHSSTSTTTSVDASGHIGITTTTDRTLNKYDIPLMWSGIATTQRRTQETFQLTPDPKSSAYWPIPLALLARGLGGCGLHNAMIYVRSLPSCFQRWNLTQWTFDQMLPVYKSLETYEYAHYNPQNATISEAVEAWRKTRGTDGPIRTTPARPDADAMAGHFIKAALASGLPLAGGPSKAGFNQVNPEDRLGAGYYEFNTRNGVRHSVVNAMLGGGKVPSNLLVLTGRTVTQVLWSTSRTRNGQSMSKPKAIGVTYLDNETGDRGKIMLSDTQLSEVILASGAIMTPQILWNSGVGDGGSLVDLPGVGKNLQDHPVLGMAFEIKPETAQESPQMYAVADEMEDYQMAVQVLNDIEEQMQREQSKESSSKNRDEEAFRQKQERVSSKLGSLGTSGFSSGAFLKSPWADGSPPDIQLTVFPRVIEPHQPKSKRQVDVNFMRSNAMLVTVALLEPEARYEVRPSDLDSLGVQQQDDSNTTNQHSRQKTAPFRTATNNGDQIAADFANVLQYPLPSISLPKGQTEYLSETDVKRLAWGMEQVRRILSHPPLSNITTVELYPGPSVVDDGVTLHQYIRANHLANSHWVGTTKMGRDDDPLAVLDESLRVRGVNGLRVFDSGAIPVVPNGNTHSTVCAVASRGVDLIVEELESV